MLDAAGDERAYGHQVFQGHGRTALAARTSRWRATTPGRTASCSGWRRRRGCRRTSSSTTSRSRDAELRQAHPRHCRGLPPPLRARRDARSKRHAHARLPRLDRLALADGRSARVDGSRRSDPLLVPRLPQVRLADAASGLPADAATCACSTAAAAPATTWVCCAPTAARSGSTSRQAARRLHMRPATLWPAPTSRASRSRRRRSMW